MGSKTMGRMIVGLGILVLCTIGIVGTVCAVAASSEVADAVEKGDLAAVQRLLQQKADVNLPQVGGATALHWAVYQDDLRTTDLLIRAGAKVDVANQNGITPLHMASLYGNAG